MSADKAAVVTSEDGVFRVEVPKGAVNGAGRLIVESATGSDGRKGWTVTLDGAELTKAATVSFDVDVADGEPAPIVTYASDANSAGKTAVASTYQDGVVFAKTDHFSFWSVESWQSALDDLTTPRAENKSPKCTGEIEPTGVEVTAEKGLKILWCAGVNVAKKPYVILVNPRPFTVSVEYTPGVTLAIEPKNDVVEALADLIKERPSKPGNKVVLVPPGDTAEFEYDMTRPAGIRALPSVPGYLVSAAEYAVDTVLMVWGKAGATGNRSKALKVLQGSKCLVGYQRMSGDYFDNAAEMAEYVSGILGTAGSCVGDMLREGDAAALNVAGVVTWLWDGVMRAAAGLWAAVDTGLDPKGFNITMTAPEPKAPTWGDLEIQCRGYTGLAADRACEQRDAETMRRAYVLADAFIAAWLRRDRAAMVSMATDAWYIDGMALNNDLVDRPKKDCDYVPKESLYCYVETESGVWMGFRMGMELPDPASGPVWKVSGIAPDNGF